SAERPLALIGPAHFSISPWNEFLQIVRRAPLGPGQIRAELSQPRLYGCGLDGRDTGGIELADDRRGRRLWQEDGEPVRRGEIGQPLLVRRWDGWQARRAVAGEDGDRLDRLALDLPDRDRRIRALVVDPPGDQILHGRRRATIGNVGDGNA